MFVCVKTNTEKTKHAILFKLSQFVQGPRCKPLTYLVLVDPLEEIPMKNFRPQI